MSRRKRKSALKCFLSVDFSDILWYNIYQIFLQRSFFMDIDGNLSAHRTRPLSLCVAIIRMIEALANEAAAEESSEQSGKRRMLRGFCTILKEVLYSPSESLESGPGITARPI